MFCKATFLCILNLVAEHFFLSVQLVGLRPDGILLEFRLPLEGC